MILNYGLLCFVDLNTKNKFSKFHNMFVPVMKSVGDRKGTQYYNITHSAHHINRVVSDFIHASTLRQRIVLFGNARCDSVSKYTNMQIE